MCMILKLSLSFLAVFLMLECQHRTSSGCWVKVVEILLENGANIEASNEVICFFFLTEKFLLVSDNNNRIVFTLILLSRDV